MFFKKKNKNNDAASKKESDKRRHERFRADWDISMIKPKVGLIRGSIKNISESGMGIYAEFDQDLEINKVYTVDFTASVRGKEYPLHLSAQVMYRLPLLGDLDYSYGLQFVNMTEKQEKDLKRLIRSITLELPK